MSERAEGHARGVGRIPSPRCGAVSMPSEPMTAADTIVAVAFDMWVKMGEERTGSEERGKEEKKKGGEWERPRPTTTLTSSERGRDGRHRRK